MATIKQAKEFDIEKHVINSDVSYRGGSLRVDVSDLFGEQAEANGEQAIMGAYQNYLGGGIAGSIQGASMFNPACLNARDRKAFEILTERIKKYFYSLNNGGGDDYMQENANYERTQSMPVHGY